jgi:hypothetical protein
MKIVSKLPRNVSTCFIKRVYEDSDSAYLGSLYDSIGEKLLELSDVPVPI